MITDRIRQLLRLVRENAELKEQLEKERRISTSLAQQLDRLHAQNERFATALIEAGRRDRKRTPYGTELRRKK